MMRIIASICIVTTVMMLSGVCLAQMSTIPSPPPLPPLSKSASNQSDNGSSSTPANPGVGPGNQGATGTPNGSPSGANPSAPNANGTSPDNSIPITAATLTSMSALDDKNPLHPGDRISFRVIEDRDEAIPRTVTDTGEVDFPYVGRIKVQGQTCLQVANQLKQLLEVDYYKRATVIVGLDVMADHPVFHEVAWLIGQVRGVGPQELSKAQPVTVSQLILRSGGFGDFADQRKVRIIHHSSAVPGATNIASADNDDVDSQKDEIIDVKSVYEGHSTYDPIVEPNDYIIVPKKLVNF